MPSDLGSHGGNLCESERVNEMDWAGLLRDQLRKRARAWAERPGVLAYESRGTPATTLFQRSPDGGSHGSFFEEAWTAIKANSEWSHRLEKHHPQRNALPAEYRTSAMELDSSNSSDALLMNCFCYPGASVRFARILGTTPVDAIPQFGYPALIQRSHQSPDSTEVDMLLGDTFVEAKLTEGDFTSKSKEMVLRYAALQQVFDVDLLPSDEQNFCSYQLIRNVLAAAQHGKKLIVLVDFRRPDLLEHWWQVHAAISAGELRKRCGVRFWQQLTAAADPHHRGLLQQKYGI